MLRSRPRRTVHAVVCSLPLFVFACSSSSAEPPPTPKPVTKARHKPTVFPVLADAVTTKDKTLVVKATRQKDTDGPNPSNPTALDDYLKRGFGDQTDGAGEPYITRTIDDS